MRCLSLLPVLAVPGLLGHACQANEPSDARSAERIVNLRPPPPLPMPRETLEASIHKGVEFLVKDQNKDGSWGSANRTKNLNIYAPAPGAHHAFRTAVTSLCVAALIEVASEKAAILPPSTQQAIERGENYLFTELGKTRRQTADAIYNVWTHAYGIQALVRMHGRLPNDKERQKKIEGMIQEQFNWLRRYESTDGGWGYYDMGAGTQRPNSSSTSFVNGAVLIAFHEAKKLGLEPPEKVTRRAIEATKRQEKPDHSYLYGEYLKWRPMRPINRPAGSLGRSQCCNAALRMWGDERITDDVLKDWLDRLITRNGWLSMGRKRPVPHESFFQVAGYFYYFGHYYAGRCVEELKPADRPFYQDHLARIIIGLQEKDGSWWDYPLYNYHQQYGTAFALMTLHRCQKK